MQIRISSPSRRATAYSKEAVKEAIQGILVEMQARGLERWLRSLPMTARQRTRSERSRMLAQDILVE